MLIVSDKILQSKDWMSEGHFIIQQGQGNDILTNNSKVNFHHNPLPLFLPLLTHPSHEKTKYTSKYYKIKGFVIFFIELIVTIATPDHIVIHIIKQDFIYSYSKIRSFTTSRCAIITIIFLITISNLLIIFLVPSK